jgi:eukaryotic-like serine/threonine-protein kinase
MTREALQREAEERLARGDTRGAAESFERGGLYLEAARTYRAAGLPLAALASITRVSVEDPRYRDACVAALALATEQDRITLALENFLARFLRDAPRDHTEEEALLSLAGIYERQGYPENAAEIFERLADTRPDCAAAAARLRCELAPPLSELAELPTRTVPLPAQPPDQDRPVEPGSTPAERVIFQPGAVIAGRYRLEERIGTGGMSVVFRATDLELNDKMAIKVLTRAVFDAVTDARLRRELMLSRQLVHPNIVRIFEIGIAQGLRYLIMELLTGYRLADRLHHGALGLDESLDFLVQACAGLQGAHDLGIIHRDVKPGNLFVATGGVLKVMDFGLAKMRDAPGLTSSGAIGGTPVYMAPEQASDLRSVGPTTDIYALGIVAYELVTGTVPFRHENPLSILIMHREQAPLAPRTLNPAVPEQLEQIILRCLAKEPQQRFGSCRELGRTLSALRSR